MANRLPNQDPAVPQTFEKILEATHVAADKVHAGLDDRGRVNNAAHSKVLTDVLNNFDAVITKKLSEMHQKHVSSSATLFSQSAELKNPSSVEADNSTSQAPSKC